MHENEISGKIVACSVEVHKNLGPGLLESVYENVLAYELRKSGLSVLQQVPVPIKYKSLDFSAAFKLDLLVNNKVIIELKSIERFAPVHEAQILTYLRLSDKKLGLLINFNVSFLKKGIVRYANKL